MLLVAILFTAGLRLRLLDVPLERDEGEYAYAGQQILRGLPPYLHVHGMKLPGVYVAYAGILAVFGNTPAGIHGAHLLINAASVLLLFLTVRRLIDPTAGLVAGASFAVLSIGRHVQGTFANAEHLLILFALAGLCLLLRALDDRRDRLLPLAGLLFGGAILMKQQGAAFALLGAVQIGIVSLCERPFRWRTLASRLALLAAGVVTPYALACVVLALSGAFEAFWFWTVDYARDYASRIPLESGWRELLRRAGRLWQVSPLLWSVVGLGLTALAWDRVGRRQAPFILAWVVLSFVAVSTGLYFRPHYFLLLLPAAALLAGLAISAVMRRLAAIPWPLARWGLPALVVLACLVQPLVRQREILFRLSPLDVSRAVFELNPFPESVEVGRYLRDDSDERDRIAVFGSEPQIYFYAERQAATAHIYMYPLMETHELAREMQDEMIREVEAARPEFMVYVRVRASWLWRRGSHDRLQSWFERYRLEHYERVGLVEISRGGSSYHWQPDVPWPPRTRNWIEIVKRKT